MALAATNSVLFKLANAGPSLIGYGTKQVANYWTKARNRKDMRRRELAKQYAPERLRLVAMKRNDILPEEIRELASKGFDNIPRQSAIRQLRARCVVTSRGYGTVIRWRVSRFIFRHLVDYNKMCGIQRAIW